MNNIWYLEVGCVDIGDVECTVSSIFAFVDDINDMSISEWMTSSHCIFYLF